MPKRYLAALVSSGLLALVACGSESHPLADDIHFAIIDAAHGGAEGFYFLRPMVPSPTPQGTFDPTLSPEVHICEVDGGGTCGAPVAVFDMRTGPGSETVRLSEVEEKYVVNWHIGDFEISAGVYRVRVLVAGQELGFADVAVWSRGEGLRNLNTGEVVALRNGRTLPIQFRIEEGAVQATPAVAAGARHTCVLRADGVAMCAGWNQYGQLGDGTLNSSAEPVRVAGNLRFETVATGSFSTCGITGEGEAYCWGFNRYGQVGGGFESDGVSEPTIVAGGYRWESVAPGYLHACGLTTDGDVLCWGYNGDGAIGVGAPSYVELVPRVIASGYGSVASLYRHTCALTLDGRPDCWGLNVYGQVGSGSTQPDRIYSPLPVVGALSLSELDAGWNHTCGLTEAGAVWCWGYDYSGSLGDGSPDTSPPYGSASPVQATTPEPLRSLSVGGHTCGLTRDERALCWGYDRYGQLGTGDPTLANPWGIATPQAVSGTHTYQAIEAGMFHTCGVTSTAEVLCWGYNAEGGLGTGEITPSAPYGIATPTPTLFGQGG